MTTVDRSVEGGSHERLPGPVWLSEADGSDLAALGAKATNLAIAARAGLPVVEGFVLPYGSPPSPVVGDPVHRAWSTLSADGREPVVVRSSSSHEDGAGSSMAGVFDSVVDVRGWEPFVTACLTVWASGGDDGLAVLVQRHVDPTLGGVLFGVDPVTGRTDRRVVAAVAGGPWQLVSGEVDGRRVTVDVRGRVVGSDGDDAPRLSRPRLRSLIRLERSAARLFGGPQDIEWAIDGDRLLLLQSRPVTAVASRGSGPLLGAGPVAETFPAPLSALEQDLWVPPLAEATAEALALTGAVSSRRRAAGSVIQVIDGQVVADLEVTGFAPRGGNRVLRFVDPRPGVRRLRASWRVGRLQGAIGLLAADVVERVDAAMAGVGDLRVVDDERLLTLLDNCCGHLRALHGHEILAGALGDGAGGTGAAWALQAIAEGRARGWSDEDIIACTPVVLAVVPPAIAGRPALPAVPDSLVDGPAPAPLADREQLRLRVRWMHELTRVVALELGRRLAARGALVRAADVRHLRLADLRLACRGTVVSLVDAPAPPTPLPAAFRIAPDGSVVAERPPDGSAGVGAGGGRGVGTVAHADPAVGDVLVVEHLAPHLAPLLPRLAGIVAETGSPLSHLAILAREHHVPVVVGHAEARRRFPTGTRVVVDGHTGEVEAVPTPQGVDA